MLKTDDFIVLALLSFPEFNPQHNSYNVFILIASQTITNLDLKSYTPLSLSFRNASPPLPTFCNVRPLDGHKLRR